MLLPLTVSLFYREPARYLWSWAGTILLTFSLGWLLARRRDSMRKFYAKEGFVIVALSWLLLSLFGALPFVFSGDIPALVDAYFETASGFTTSGSSILTDVEALAHSMLWWRSFTHLIGGMGVLVFALAVLPKTESESVHIMRAEVPGPTFGKIVSKLSSSARILYLIYLAMTAVTIGLLLLAGLPLFDATTLAFGAAGTGGFGILNGSIAPYNNLAVEIILGIAMIVFGVNFNLYYFMLIKQFKTALTSEELKWYLGIIAGAILLITLNLSWAAYGPGQALRDSFFAVASIITTTGYSTADFGQWPLFSQVILLSLMFIGGMAGSTAGGLKISRIGILCKAAIAELKKTSSPNRVLALHFEKSALPQPTIRSVANYLIVYCLVFAAILLVISLDTPDFETAFSSVAATFNNIGPGLGAVGPAGSFAGYSDFSTGLLSLTMIMGRLEIFPILILFAPSTWQRRG